VGLSRVEVSAYLGRTIEPRSRPRQKALNDLKKRENASRGIRQKNECVSRLRVSRVQGGFPFGILVKWKPQGKSIAKRSSGVSKNGSLLKGPETLLRLHRPESGSEGGRVGSFEVQPLLEPLDPLSVAGEKPGGGKETDHRTQNFLLSSLQSRQAERNVGDEEESFRASRFRTKTNAKTEGILISEDGAVCSGRGSPKEERRA